MKRSAFETASSQTGATTLSCESPGIVAAIAKARFQLQQSPATTTISTISTADLSFISPLNSVPFHLKIQNNTVDKQLTHISATSFDVALPSISDLVTQDQLQGMSRLGRATLRKTQAIEDDDHLNVVTSQDSLNNLAPPNHNLQPCQTSSFEDDDTYVKPSVTALSLTTNNHFPAQPPMAAPVALSLNNGVNHIGEAALQLLLQHQIKQETFPQAESILNWTKSGDLFANQLLNLGPLAGLSFPNLVQSHSVDLASNTDEYRAAAAAAAAVSSAVSGSVSSHSITERKPHSFDMAKFAESRNVHSTESTASTSSEPSFRGSDVPRKSVIQDDIRMGKGRFKLVKKRGRSDVWNLFGQVMDTATGQRLPFVACYACKVLYTDTGGGTGNMTRHRCPLGASYRSVAGSSVETLNESFNANSFESYHGPSPEIDKISSFLLTNLKILEFYESLVMSNTLLQQRFGNTQSVSKSFETPMPQPTTCSQQISVCRPLQTQVSNLSSAGSISLQASSSSTESAPPGLLSCGSLSLDVPSTPNAPSILIQSTTTQLTSNICPEIISNSSATSLRMEKEKMLKIVAQYCINSYELPCVVNKPSFIKLLEETFSCARRLFPSHQQHADYKSFAELIPTEMNLSKFIKQQSNTIRDELRKHFQTTQQDGIVLICQELRYADRKLMTIWTSFIGGSWEYERICIAVKENENDLAKILVDVADNYGFGHAPMIWVTLDDSMPVLDRPTLPPNMHYIDNVVQAINEILVNAINECANLPDIIKLVDVYQTALNVATELDLQNAAKSVLKSIITNDEKISNALDLHRLLKQFRICYDSWKQQLSLRNKNEIIAIIEQVDKMVAHNLESFLEPFFEVTQTLSSTNDLHFHTVLPEWHALIHECASVDDESDYSDLKHAQNPSSLSDRPRRRSLRHQKSIDDEPILQIDDDDSNSVPICDKKDTWMKSLRKRVEIGLKNWAHRHLGYDHRIATALNPMMRKLPIICTDTERLLTYSKIRQNAGLLKVNENKTDQNLDDYEPLRKRQNFLSKLEDQGMAHDELDNYLNVQIVPQEGRSLTEFWSKAQNLPKLAKYARSVLPMIAAAMPIHLRHVTNCSLTDEDFADMLILKTSSLFTDHNQTSGSHRS